MKKVLGILILVGMGLLAFEQVLRAEEGLVGHWSFDEGQENIACDSSGNGNNGTIYGATWVDGISGKALSFDGIDDYVRVPYHPSIDITDKLTMEAWVYFRGEGINGGAIFEKYNTYSGWMQYSFCRNSSPGYNHDFFFFCSLVRGTFVQIMF